MYNQKLNKVGKVESDGGCFKVLWGIMFGKDGPLRIPTFVAAHFMDQHYSRLRELATDEHHRPLPPPRAQRAQDGARTAR